MLRSIPLTLLCLGLLGTVSVRADEASDRHAAALGLINQMYMSENMAQLGQGLVAQVRMAATHGDPDLNKAFDGFAPKLLTEADAEKPALVDQLAGIYTKTFTADELKEVTAFYQTPVGKKILGSQSQIGDEVIRATQDWGSRLGQKLLAEARANLQAKP